MAAGLTDKDKALLDEAYSTTYKSTVRKLIRQAESEECKRVLTKYLNEYPE